MLLCDVMHEQEAQKSLKGRKEAINREIN
jgi:hypothetical protein